jgi:hypothetical protein
LGWGLFLVLAATALQAQPCGTPGRDGSGTITGVVNTYYPGNGNAAAGATSLPVGTPSGNAARIAAGDLLLVIQMQDAAINSTDTSSYGDGTAGGGNGSTALNSSGLYEFVTATAAVSGGSVPILSGGNGGKLLNSYTNAAATGTQGQRRWQVIRVPQYSSATLSAGLTALAWTGTVGGVLAIDVSGTLALGSVTVSVDGKGFRGGGGRSITGGTGSVTFSNTAYRTLATDPWHGSKAEGIAGTPRYVYDGTTLTDTTVEGYPNGSYARGAPGNAGGGGTDGANNNGDNSGGGGGGNGGAGGGGGNTWNSNNATGGVGGAAFAATSTRLAMGGGGGAGSSNNAGPGHGNPGGGMIFFRFNRISGTGTLTANGTTPPDSTQDGAGGAGAGGSVFAASCNGNLTGLTVNAQGARGGNVNWTAGDFHGPGGGGGGGVVYLSSAATAISVTGGANGTSPTATAYGATSGSNGTSATNITVGTPPGARAGCICAVTQAVLSGFRAVAAGNALVVEWETASEVATAGFYLYRFEEATKGWRRVNDRLLAAAETSPQGAFYRLVDPAAPAREAQTYSLVEVENGGSTRSYGPFRVEPAASPGSAADTAAPTEGAARAPRRPRASAVPPVSRAAAPPPGMPSALKLWVREPGVYSLSAAGLATALSVPVAAVTDWIRKGKIDVTRQGASVSWQAAADASSLRFYGEASPSLYSAENVYWLTPGKAGKTGRTASGGSPAAAAGPQSFLDTAHVEQDRFAAIAIAPDPESDYWYWDFAVAGDPAYGTRSLPFDLHGLASSTSGAVGTAALTVHLQGATSSGVTGEHHATVLLNGTPVGDTSWDGITPRDATFAVSSALLLEGTNTVAITASLDSGAPYSIFYVNSFDISYPRRYQAAAGALRLRGAGNPVVTVDGFASPQILVWDLSDPRTPAALVGTTIEPSPAPGAGYRVSFVPASPDRPYLAVDIAAAPSLRLEAWTQPANLLASPANGADYLVIAPAAWTATAEGLAQLRRDTGLTAQVVPLEQVYDEFNDGLPGPWALQRFLAWAGTRWSRKPSMVVLAGGGNYDYRNLLGLGANPIPPLLVRTEQGLFASDPRLAQGTGMVIGRLPVASAAELQTVIDKIAAYEAAPANPSDTWRQNVLLAADNPDDGGQFDWESDLSAALIPPPYLTQRIYLSQLSLSDARQQLFDGLSRGAFLFNYLGHAGLDRLAAEPLLASSDLSLVQNAGGLPVVAAMACIVGRFEIPGFTSLAAQLVNRPGSGAIAVWAPTGVNWNAQSGVLDRAFLAALFQDRRASLGGAVSDAVQRFQAAGASPATLLTYNLFGDPALRLRRQF